MLAYITRRLLLALVTMVAISAISFVIILLPPGDYITFYVAQQLAEGTTITSQEAEALRARYGLNQPVAVQYLKWMNAVVRGDFGMSLSWQRDVAGLIWERLLLTVVLSLAAVLFTWALALPIGIYSAVRQYSVGDYLFTFISFIGLAVPNFLLALALMYLGFAFFDANIGGLFSPEYLNAPWSMARVWDLLKHVPLPATILALGGTAQVVRVMRANLLDELRKPYVTTARAKGLSERHVILVHPVRVALNPFVSTIGYLFPYIVSGSVIVSLVLGLPTVGPLLLSALLAQDMFLAGAIVLMLGAMTVIGTLISDLLLMWIDPRVRSEG
ncbi:MAG: ABC transporter permease [Thermomicrobiales bacterium]